MLQQGNRYEDSTIQALTWAVISDKIYETSLDKIIHISERKFLLSNCFRQDFTALKADIIDISTLIS